MRDVEKRMAASDVALCWLRISGCLMLMSVHGLPKLLHFQRELGLIEDPFGMGSGLTLSLAIFAEVLCPVLIIVGVLTRLATLPILFLLAVSVILSGVAVQYLLFNMQARYFWSNIETQNSFVHDFQKPTYEGVVRMGVCLFTFAFPTFIIAYIFQLILG